MRTRGQIMLYVFEVEDYPADKPHAVAKIKCRHCRSVYLVVVPAPQDGEPFECPECHQTTSFNRQKMRGDIA